MMINGLEFGREIKKYYSCNLSVIHSYLEVVYRLIFIFYFEFILF